MKLEQQFCSLELAKKLKELGFEQKSLFYIREDGFIPNELIFRMPYDESGLKWFSAYTVAELLELLPNDKIRIFKINDLYFVEYYTVDELEFCEAGERFVDKNLSNALAKMLIYLKENNLIN